ncbi:MAG TPA: cytochrome c oxidase assembly protein [candidate division Zixibacteria bacterium]|nr:cytochrome c oxidase assembly protein [candidate division Zixibacteria bacterium]
MQPEPDPKQPKKKKNLRLFLILAGLGIFMFVFAFINVPLFRMYCQKVGIAISPNTKASPESKSNGRKVTVLFTSVVANNAPILFKPKESFQTIPLGETAKNEYRFVNMSNDTIYFRPVHSVLPEDAATKLTLSKCFCFDDQVILPHQEYILPVLYSFKSDLDSEVENITMHYTLFPKEKKNKK